jgi:hypothetical protein
MTVPLVHLSDEQFAELALGGAAPEACAVHLAGCERCRAELDRFGASVALFNTASLGWSEARPGKSLREEAGRRGSWAAWGVGWVPVGLALAAAALLMVGVPAWRDGHRIAPEHVAVMEAAPDESAAEIARDNALLRSVDMALSANEPSPVEEYGLAEGPRARARTEARSR